MGNPQKLTTRVYRSIAEIDPREWNSIFPRIAEGYYFFKTADESLRGQFKPYYIALYESSQLVCIAPCFIMDYPLDTTIEGFLKKAASWLVDRLPKLFILRTLVCGSQAAEGRIGASDLTRSDMALTLVEAMDAIAKNEHAKLVAFKDFSDDYSQFFRILMKHGFHRMQSYPSVELEICFSSFEEYLSSLSRPTRKNLKKKFRQLETLPPIEMEVRSELGELLDQAYTLYLSTLEKSQVQFEHLTKEFFENISLNMPSETRYFLWRINGKLVAFDLCLVSNGTLVDEYIGMDYSVAYTYHLYYLTFRDIVKWCIEHGIKKYESGALNYDPKKRLDFKFIPEYIYARHPNNVMNLLWGILFFFLKPENFDPVLKALKKEKG